jgi:hypothetical protein
VCELILADVKQHDGAPVRRCSGSDSTMMMLRSENRRCSSTLMLFTDLTPPKCYKTRPQVYFVTAGCPKSRLSCKSTRLAKLSKGVEADSLDEDDSVVLSEQEVVSLGADAQRPR